MTLLPRCICGSTGSAGTKIYGVPVMQCTSCGIVRQNVPWGEAQLVEWYRDQYAKSAYTHSYEQDLEVANKRLAAYRITPREDVRVLDVGCGNGAFVRAARARGLDAWGQELSAASNSEHIYVGALEDVAFPTDSFDVVTLHDVLEHLPHPQETLREVYRILRRPGKLIIDFPAFFKAEGKHHWKLIEHLWMFDEEQLVRVVEAAGFKVTDSSRPIPSKFVIECDKIAESRPQILVPPGIGDSLWSVTKLRGLLRAKGLGLADVWVQHAGGPKRTQPFLNTIPFLHAAGYKELSDRSPVFHEAYMQDGRTIFPDVAGCDYFIAYNGVLRFGKRLEEVDAEYGCEWRPKMHVSKEAQAFADKLKGPGPYVFTYWAEAGMYRRWLAEFPKEQIAEALKLIERKLGFRIIFFGAPWDRGQVGRTIAQMDDGWLDLIGATSFDQMLGGLLGASAVVGFPAGNTILGAVLNRPTVLLWNDYFQMPFWENCCPPDASYSALATKGLWPERLLFEVERQLDGGPPYA